MLTELEPELEAQRGLSTTLCKRSACRQSGAAHWNRVIRAFYCTPCARILNDNSQLDDPLCDWPTTNEEKEQWSKRKDAARVDNNIECLIDGSLRPNETGRRIPPNPHDRPVQFFRELHPEGLTISELSTRRFFVEGDYLVMEYQRKGLGWFRGHTWRLNTVEILIEDNPPAVASHVDPDPQHP